MAGMMTGLLLLLLVGVTVGRVVDLQKRIIGGQTCAATERLHHVKLISDNRTHSSLCGGTLIDKEWILTAGHCVEPGWTMKAVLGVHPVDNEKQKTVVINIDHVIRYEEEGRNGKLIHDMALLKLDQAVEGLAPVKLPDCEHRPQINDIVQIAGLGPTDVDGKTFPATLQCANTMVYECDDPMSLCKVIYFQTFEKKFCFRKTNVDARHGDSGGGVMFNDMIYGVQIRSGEKACTTPVSALDLCADKYKDWIKNKTKVIFP